MSHQKNELQFAFEEDLENIPKEDPCNREIPLYPYPKVLEEAQRAQRNAQNTKKFFSPPTKETKFFDQQQPSPKSSSPQVGIKGGSFNKG